MGFPRHTTTLTAIANDLTSLESALKSEGAAMDTSDGVADYWDAKTTQATVDDLRASLQAAQATIAGAQSCLSILLQAGTATSRAGYLRTLDELIGPPPEKRTWHDEWVPMCCEFNVLNGTAAKEPEWADPEYVKVHDTIEENTSHFRSSIDGLVARGWPFEAAQAYKLLNINSNATAAALRERDTRYAASTYQLCDVLFAQRRPGEVPPPLYLHRRGKYSLVEQEPAWERLEEPDRTGFCGLTCSSVIEASCEPANFSEGGYALRLVNKARGVYYEHRDGDVICLESAPDDENGCHSAILLEHDQKGAFPPNTLFRLKEVRAAGQWEAPPASSGVYPNQRLLVCTATYQPPRAGLAAGGEGSGKMVGAAAMLSYGKRTAYVEGIDDLFAKPVLSMADEFARDDSWADWRGVSYTLKSEWKYVTGPASLREDCTPGRRDGNNHGKTVDQFVEEVNEWIQQRRALGHGTKLPLSYALLTREEVVAVRLYSGPAYQPINGFLRQVANLTGEHRLQMAQHARLSFAATIGHLCRAIRKLAAVATAEEASAPLWRGVRGILPEQFWMPDGKGMVCAVDMAFMSTSRQRQTPIDYMGRGSNVLWELKPQAETDAAYHRGADISMLSQFAGEQEVLFPPCTMLVARQADGAVESRVEVSSESNQAVARLRAKLETSDEEDANTGKTFVSVSVLPYFL